MHLMHSLHEVTCADLKEINNLQRIIKRQREKLDSTTNVISH